MAEEDVWAPLDGSHAPAHEVEPGDVAYGEGLWLNQSFSLELVFRHGFALFREQPLLLLGATGLIWLSTMLPQLLTIPGDIVRTVLEESGNDAAIWIELGNSLFGLVVALAFFPLQILFTTGAIAAIGHYLQHDEVSWARLFNTLRPAGWNLLHRLMVGIVEVVVVLAALVPAIGLIGLSIWLDLGPFVVGAVLLCSWAVAFWIFLYVHLALSLGQLAVALDGKGPLEAMIVAWEAAHGARFTLFAFALVYVLCYLLGCCVLFLIGTVPVMAVFLGGAVTGWLLYARREEDVRAWPFFVRNPLPW